MATEVTCQFTCQACGKKEIGVQTPTNWALFTFPASWTSFLLNGEKLVCSTKCMKALLDRAAAEVCKPPKSDVQLAAEKGFNG